MTAIVAIFIGAILGGLAGWVGTYAFPRDAAESETLPLRYIAWSFGNVKFLEGTPNEFDAFTADADFTNQSERNMSLRISLLVKLPTEPAEIVSIQSDVIWRPNGSNDPPSDIINIPRESSVKGHLLLKLLPLKLMKQVYPTLRTENWADIGAGNFAFRIEDSVSGKSVLSNASHYPSDKVWESLKGQ